MAKYENLGYPSRTPDFKNDGKIRTSTPCSCSTLLPLFVKLSIHLMYDLNLFPFSYINSTVIAACELTSTGDSSSYTPQLLRSGEPYHNEL
jgi:hypothetical protein